MLALSACSDDVPPIPTDELYLRGFIKQFGVPAKDHSWSMAEPVQAEVALGPSVGGTATFYTASPLAPGSEVLASAPVSAGRASLRFDMRAGSTRVYVRVTAPDGAVSFAGYTDIADGRATVSAAGSRAEASPATATPLEYHVQRINDAKLKVLADYLKAHPEAVDMSWHEIKDAIADNTTLDAVDSKDDSTVPGLYMLSNYDLSGRTPEFSIEDIAPIVHKYVNIEGEKRLGVFAEQTDAGAFEEENNITKYYHYPTDGRRLDPEVRMTVKETGPVAMDLMWRAQTENTIWGYYYYAPEDEALITTDPLAFYNKVPKYIVFSGLDGGHGSSNPIALSADNNLLEIRYCANKNDHSIPGYHFPNDDTPNHTLGNWENLTGTAARSIYNQEQYYYGAMLRGVNFKLTYFGPDGKGEPTYDFPAGTRIGFFIARAGDPNKFYFGDARLNYYIFHYHYGGAKSPAETPEYFPFAAKFGFMGQNYLGFEDGGLDNDLNDVVFRIYNTWPPEQDLTPEDLPKPEPAEWIVACEDLGSTDDYDFNDIVLKLSRVAGTTELRVTPLACGGVLDSHIHFGSTDADDYWNEIHALLGVPSGQMAGVGNGYPDIDFSRVATKTFTVDADWIASEHYGDFHIFTQDPSATHMNEGQWISREAAPGGEQNLKAPQMLLLPADWRWPLERKNITVAYPDFREWIGKPGENPSWTTSPSVDTSILYKRIDR